MNNTIIGLRFDAILRAFRLPSLGSEVGQTFTEYALILTGIALTVALLLTLLSGPLKAVFSNVGSAI